MKSEKLLNNWQFMLNRPGWQKFEGETVTLPHCQALKRVMKSRSNIAPFSIGGYKDSLFFKQDGMPKVSDNYEGMLNGLVKKYNKQNKEPLPNITPHILRHTFCTR